MANSRLRPREAVIFLTLTALFSGAVVFVWTSPDTDRMLASRSGHALSAVFGHHGRTDRTGAGTRTVAHTVKPRPTQVHTVTHTVVVHESATSPRSTGGSSHPSSTPTTHRADTPTAVKPAALVIPARSALVAPAFRYDGVSTPEAPFDWKDLAIFTGSADKAPNMLSWYVGWDKPYDPTVVANTWAKGMLPMITWEPRPSVTPTGATTDSADVPAYALQTIIDGGHDAYIRSWAQAAAAQRMPLVLRFAHEMNGNWFPWSEQANGNSAGQYVAAWRHVHAIFAAAHATNVIWLWSPNIDTWCGTCIHTHATPMAELYPGDADVDWVGLTGYYRRVVLNPDSSTKPATFDNTFGSSMQELTQVAPAKRVLLSEIGATEIGGQKANWMRSVFAAMASNPRLLGLVWFDHSYDGNDWRIESSPSASAAWAAGVTDPTDHFGSAFDVDAPVAAPRGEPIDANRPGWAVVAGRVEER